MLLIHILKACLVPVGCLLHLGVWDTATWLSVMAFISLEEAHAYLRHAVEAPPNSLVRRMIETHCCKTLLERAKARTSFTLHLKSISMEQRDAFEITVAPDIGLAVLAPFRCGLVEAQLHRNLKDQSHG
jgi:hypothetical protein